MVRSCIFIDPLYTEQMNRAFFSAFSLLAVLLAGGAMGVAHIPATHDKTGRLPPVQTVEGTWAKRFEVNFGEILPLFAPARDFWGRLDFSLFGQGRAGVVVGSEGWIFTSEEFSCPHDPDKVFSDHMRFIAETTNTLRQGGSEVIVALIPAKARLYKKQLVPHAWPACRQDVLPRAREKLEAMGVPAAVPLEDMEKEVLYGRPLYLRTDTHWAPAGAALMARIVADTVKAIRMPLPEIAFNIKETTAKPYRGDLLRYLPGVSERNIESDALPGIETTGNPDSRADLFGDSAKPAAVLIGTSYSADPAWGFEAHLKAALEADLVNLADKGLGPFSVMKAYLDKRPLGKTTPLLVIWEIPERYLLLPDTEQNP